MTTVTPMGTVLSGLAKGCENSSIQAQKLVNLSLAMANHDDVPRPPCSYRCRSICHSRRCRPTWRSPVAHGLGSFRLRNALCSVPWPSLPLHRQTFLLAILSPATFSFPFRTIPGRPRRVRCSWPCRSTEAEKNYFFQRNFF